VRQSKDVIVVGGGMAGLAAALAAGEVGAGVLVLESEPAVGGSMALSGGLIWAPAPCVPHQPALLVPAVPERLQGRRRLLDVGGKRIRKTDFVADFRQETQVKTLNRSLKANGKISYKRPGKMLWNYENPKGQFVLADGKYLYYFQPEQNQVIKSPLKNAFRGDIPLSFLLGLGNLKKDFNASLKGTEENLYMLRLEPKGEAGGYSEILLGVTKSSYDIQRVSVRDAAGVSIILILSDINMPGMTGLELLPKAKAVRPDVPVIMITAYGDAETKRIALEGGAEALFTRPIDFRALRSEIGCVRLSVTVPVPLPLASASVIAGTSLAGFSAAVNFT
jgi:outer membrane lipoprotein-sorting protein